MSTIETSVREWLAYAKRAQYHPAILAYIRVYPGDIRLAGAPADARLPSKRGHNSEVPAPTSSAWARMNAILGGGLGRYSDPVPDADEEVLDKALDVMVPSRFAAAVEILGEMVGSGLMTYVNGLENRARTPEPEPVRENHRWWEARRGVPYETPVVDNRIQAITERHEGFFYRFSSSNRRPVGPFPSFSAAEAAMANARVGFIDPVED